MADIFISYSKKHAGLTEALARDLEAEGYSTWWDTSLVAGVEFPREIQGQLDAAKAVIVVWTESSVSSQWVHAEATRADAQKKLITVRDAALEIHEIPLPFNTRHTELVSDRARIFAALAQKQIAPSKQAEAGRVTGGRAIWEAALAQQAERRRADARGIEIREKIARATGREALFELWKEDPDAVIARLQALGFVKVASQKDGKPVSYWLKPGESFRDFSEAPEMVVVPAGEFMMGSKKGEGEASEHPQHKVAIPQAFAVGKYPVTFAEWDAASAAGGVSHKPGDQGWGRGRRPVINVSWEDAQDYIKWLNSKASGNPYRLLSEAEWEYACRAGTATAYSFGDRITKNQAQYSEGGYGSASKTAESGSFPANAFGLHDMHGNVWEWCADCKNANYRGAPSDGSAWTAGDCSVRVLRGGSWFYVSQALRAAYRFEDGATGRCDYTGFRVARTF